MAVTTLSGSDPRQPKIYRGGTQVTEMQYGSNVEMDNGTFAIGNFVYSVADTNIITVSDSDTKILGLAGKASSAAATGALSIPVQLILPGDMLMIQVEDGSGNVEASDTTCVVGNSYAIKDYAANTPSRIDSASAGTEEQFVYLGPVYDAAGDSSYWGWFSPDIVGTYIQTADGN